MSVGRLPSAVTSRSFEYETPVQYRDLDPRRHVNHAVYVSYLEQAKGAFFLEILGESLADVPTVVRHLEVDYRAPIGADRTVQVALGPVAVGETSLTIEYELTADGEAAGSARTVSVLLDEDDAPSRIPDDWRERLAPYEE